MNIYVYVMDLFFTVSIRVNSLYTDVKSTRKQYSISSLNELCLYRYDDNIIFNRIQLSFLLPTT